jgi:small subunit ribosomal protein S19
MSRSLKKGPYVDAKLMKKVARAKQGAGGTIKTWARDCTIVPEMIGVSFAVHNGKDFIAVSVGEDMVGHKLGEFAPTRKFVRHGGKMQRALEASKAAVAQAAPVAAKAPEKKT